MPRNAERDDDVFVRDDVRRAVRAVAVRAAVVVPRVAPDGTAERDATDVAVLRVGVTIAVPVVRVGVVWAERVATFLVELRVSDDGAGVTVVARSREFVVPERVDMAPCVQDLVADWTDAAVPRTGVAPDVPVPLERDAARATSSYSKPRALHNTSTPRHTLKNNLKIFIPFISRLANLLICGQVENVPFYKQFCK